MCIWFCTVTNSPLRRMWTPEKRGGKKEARTLPLQARCGQSYQNTRKELPLDEHTPVGFFTTTTDERNSQYNRSHLLQIFTFFRRWRLHLVKAFPFPAGKKGSPLTVPIAAINLGLNLRNTLICGMYGVFRTLCQARTSDSSKSVFVESEQNAKRVFD